MSEHKNEVWGRFYDLGPFITTWSLRQLQLHVQ